MNQPLVSVDDILTGNAGQGDDPNTPPAGDGAGDGNGDGNGDDKGDGDGTGDGDGNADGDGDGNGDGDGDGAGDGNGDGDGDVTLIDDLRARTGFDDIEGEFEDSEEGLASFVEAAAQRHHQTQLQSLFERMPEVGQLADYMANGGNFQQYLETFNRPNSWEGIEIADDNIAQHEQIVRADMESRGFSTEMVNEAVSEMKENGTLLNNAKRSLVPLVAAEKQEKALLLENQAKAAKAAEARRAQRSKEIKQAFDTGSLQGVKLPNTKKEAFAKWMFQKDAEGMTGRERARKEMSTQQALTLDYLHFLGFDLNEAVKTAIKTQKSTGLRNRLSGGQGAGSQMSGGSGSKGGNVGKIPTVHELIGG